jgi:hypothetical protein
MADCPKGFRARPGSPDAIWSLCSGGMCHHMLLPHNPESSAGRIDRDTIEEDHQGCNSPQTSSYAPRSIAGYRIHAQTGGGIEGGLGTLLYLPKMGYAAAIAVERHPRFA